MWFLFSLCFFLRPNRKHPVSHHFSFFFFFCLFHFEMFVKRWFVGTCVCKVNRLENPMGWKFYKYGVYGKSRRKRHFKHIVVVIAFDHSNNFIVAQMIEIHIATRLTIKSNQIYNHVVYPRVLSIKQILISSVSGSATHYLSRTSHCESNNSNYIRTPVTALIRVENDWFDICGFTDVDLKLFLFSCANWMG